VYFLQSDRDYESLPGSPSPQEVIRFFLSGQNVYLCPECKGFSVFPHQPTKNEALVKYYGWPRPLGMHAAPSDETHPNTIGKFECECGEIISDSPYSSLAAYRLLAEKLCDERNVYRSPKLLHATYFGDSHRVFFCPQCEGMIVGWKREH